MEPNALLPQIDLGGSWHIAIFAGLSIAVLRWLSRHTNHAVPLSVKILWGYVLISALFILEFPALHFGPFTINYKETAGEVFAEAIFTPFAAIMMSDWIEKALPFAALFACACTWFNYPGILHAPSFNSAFAALCVPFIPPWAGIAVILTIVLHHGSTAALMLAAMLIVTIGKRRRFSYKLSYFLLSLFAASIYINSGKLFDGGERLAHYAEYMKFWAKEPRWIALGVGPGSFVWTSPMIDQFKAPIFLQMHSDWLQILWELGAVGLVLAGWVFTDAVKRSRNDLNTLAGVIGCGVFALTYHPLRFFPTALLTAWIFARAFSCKSDLPQVRPSNSSDQER